MRRTPPLSGRYIRGSVLIKFGFSFGASAEKAAISAAGSVVNENKVVITKYEPRWKIKYFYVLRDKSLGDSEKPAFSCHVGGEHILCKRHAHWLTDKKVKAAKLRSSNKRTAKQVRDN